MSLKHYIALFVSELALNFKYQGETFVHREADEEKTETGHVFFWILN